MNAGSMESVSLLLESLTKSEAYCHQEILLRRTSGWLHVAYNTPLGLVYR